MNHHFSNVEEKPDEISAVLEFQKFGLVFPVEHDPEARRQLERCAFYAGRGEAFSHCDTTTDLRLRLFDLMEDAVFRDAFSTIFNAVVPNIRAALQRRDSLDDLSLFDASGGLTASLRLTPTS